MSTHDDYIGAPDLKLWKKRPKCTLCGKEISPPTWCEAFCSDACRMRSVARNELLRNLLVFLVAGFGFAIVLYVLLKA